MPAMHQSEAAYHNFLLAIVQYVQNVVDLALLDLELHFISHVIGLCTEDVDQGYLVTLFVRAGRIMQGYSLVRLFQAAKMHKYFSSNVRRGAISSV
jgi:hypothetical protein